MSSLFLFFTDPVLRAPTIGCMLVSLAAGLIGVTVFLRKQSLIGEALSHAAYPGLILGVMIAGGMSIAPEQELPLSLIALSGAVLTALLGVWAIKALVNYTRTSSDAALCFVLSVFFGIGLTLASDIQFSFTALYRQVIAYLYGQAATMTDIHILIYGLFALIVIAVIAFFNKELQILTFDSAYAKSLGVPVKRIESLLFLLVTLAVVIGIRSVGVVMMSAMLIAPAVAARQLTNRLPMLFFLAGCFGVLSGFLGNYLSVKWTGMLAASFPTSRIILPTGPMIVLVAASICLLAILFAPQRGFLIRLGRITLFRIRCLSENLLKVFWQHGSEDPISFRNIQEFQSISSFFLSYLLWRMRKRGFICLTETGEYLLTDFGTEQAKKIVRLHRLWEIYLSTDLGVGAEKLHRNAEEMEHILTPELEKQLNALLNNPQGLLEREHGH